MTAPTKMSIEEIDEFLLSFDIKPDIGKVFWAVNSGNYEIGDEAGISLDNYASKNRSLITYDSVRMFRYQMIFAYVNGHIPKLIDHKDRNKTNDKIDNLRDTSHSVNSFNQDKQANNISRITGVSKIRHFYETKIGGTKNRIILYRGIDFFEACCARKSGELAYNKSNANNFNF